MNKSEPMCRICLFEDKTGSRSRFVSIFKQNEQFSQLNSEFTTIEALFDICGIKVLFEDVYPKVLCAACHFKLVKAYNLRKQAQRSQQTLTNMLNEQHQQDAKSAIPLQDKLDMAWAQPESDEFIEEDLNTDEEAGLNWKPEVFDGQVEGSIDGQIRCCGCDATFDRKAQLRKHSFEEHRQLRPAVVEGSEYQCNICYAHFTSKALVVAHKTGKNNARPPKKCAFCKALFRTVPELDDHVRDIHSDNMFKCCGCDLSTTSRQRLENHSNMHKEADKRKWNRKRVTLNKYQCFICYDRFKNFETYRAHELLPYGISRKQQFEKDLSATLSLCCGCKKVFETIGELKIHQEQVHKPDAFEDETLPIECSGCFKRYQTSFKLKEHLRASKSSHSFECSKCVSARRTLEELLEHMKIHKGPRGFRCCGCFEEFDSQEKLKQHSEEHARTPKVYEDETEIERPFKCHICHKKYKCKVDIRHHQQNVYYDKVHVCDICGKGFRHPQTLTVHIASHKDKSEHKCPECGKKYKHELLVRSCLRRHKNPREYRCKICKGTFKARGNLTSHMISHSDERKYECCICNFSFKRPGHLKDHMLMHTSEQRFPCRFCSLVLRSQSERSTHEIRHSGQYPYQCEICGKQHTRRMLYIQHYETHKEDSTKVHACHMCTQRYSQDHFLANHLKYVHRIESADRSWDAKFQRLNHRKKSVRTTSTDVDNAGDEEMVAVETTNDSMVLDDK
ncbi:zinc finger protein 708-like [Topomyia yanbarensis]|uniref:zinc finger protein 708-like n=1 Tax=Topomyia yanbarensis TaxID=2498891 RepID=UPI00273B430A|nr:zinc finger protein 708-like [Topomyia yanbarensis]